MWEFLIVLVVLAGVVFIVTAPLRRQRSADGGSTAESGDLELAELEAEREAKYREIRDAELDHRTGKLSDADFEATNGTLRAEAMEILRAIEREQRTEPRS